MQMKISKQKRILLVVVLMVALCITVVYSFNTGAKAGMNLYGNYEETIDLYSSSDVFQFLAFEKENIPYGVHSNEVKNTNSHNPASSGYWFNAGYPIPDPTPSPIIYTPTPTPATTPIPPPVFQVINNNSSYIDYIGSWTNRTQTGAGQNNTITLTLQSGDKAIFAFTGSAIRFYTKKGPQTGVLEIRVDGRVVEFFDGYSPAPQFQVLAYDNRYLSSGLHTIEIKNMSFKNPASTNYYAHVDWFEFY